ncbi:MAG: hypothetical protein FJ078_01175 [Cyanobacteria bacterium K_DeepCast_35m_m2_155]|nr:hypothetical protein [Cyanobacteria bacterium K_DeepCast_35m_m2_155]
MPKLLMPALLLGAALLQPLSARAGVAIGESIWDKKAAIGIAMQSVPAGAQVTSTSCQEIEVGLGNYHYLCRVEYSDPVNPSQ